MRWRWYTGAVHYKYTTHNGKIQVYVTAYTRHVFLDPVQECGRPSSVGAGAYDNGSEMTGAGAGAGAGALVLYIVRVCFVLR